MIKNYWSRLVQRGMARFADTNGCVIVTDNERDFAGIDIINLLELKS